MANRFRDFTQRSRTESPRRTKGRGVSVWRIPMRARAVVTLISGAAIAASTLFLACGTGDDCEPKPAPAADAAADGTVSEGGSKEAGETSEAAATSEAGET